MCRKRAILQSGRSEDPPNAVRLQNEGLISGETVCTFCLRARLIIGPLVLVEVRCVQSRPFLLVFIPPNEFLAFAPGATIRTGRAAVIEDANVIGPTESPTVAEIV